VRKNNWKARRNCRSTSSLLFTLVSGLTFILKVLEEGHLVLLHYS
jgi:hypothetical protein